MRCWRFDQAVILKVEGQDAPRYTNARLTNNVKLLQVAGGFIAAALNAQGKALALFSVFRVSEESFLLAADGGSPEQIRQAFSQFIVADRVTVSDVSGEYAFFHVVPEGSHDLAQGALSFLRRRGFQGGLDVVAPRSALADSSRIGDSELISAEERLARRLSEGIPVHPDEINESIVFSETGLKEAVAISKGCYVGQEVVEKIEAIGKTARILQRVSFHGLESLPRGSAVMEAQSGEMIGSLLVSSPDLSKENTIGLARVKNDPSLAEREITCGDRRGTLFWIS